MRPIPGAPDRPNLRGCGMAVVKAFKSVNMFGMRTYFTGVLSVDSSTIKFYHGIGIWTCSGSFRVVDGADTIGGGEGDDVLGGYGGRGSLIGGAAANHFTGNKGDNVLSGAAGRDTLIGGSGVDLLDGGDHADSLRGDAGNDTLIGGMGNDTLIGSWDSDRLIGGTGRDRLTGGKGADSFVFTYPADSRTGAMRDIITDLRSGVDMIDLTAITEGTAMTGNFTGNQAGAFAVWYVVRGDDLLLRADTTGDGAADFVLTLTGVDHLGASDILL